ncbi:MAG: alkaline phosphatase family protein [Bacteroidia bacterium]|nr:alkaline phosphatase family protein [Bacteroidia bacterium]
MKEFYFLLLLLTLGIMGCEKPAPPKAVFIILDGIPADVLEKINTPALDAISQAGGYTRAYVGGETGQYNETPTISAPGYMSLITATWANKHNVWGNDNLSPNYHYWNVFRAAETANPALTTAVFSTWLDNRTELIGEGKTSGGTFRIDYAFDGFEKDTVSFPHDSLARYILEIDEHVSDEAGKYIETHGPDLSWVYLEYTDDMGHRYGDSEQFYNSVQTADAQVKKIWDAVKKRQNRGEDWLIVVTTDHGRDSLTGQDHGGQSLRERKTWISTNARTLNKSFSEQEPGIVDIGATLLRHLDIKTPEAVAYEMDGIAFAGDISFYHPEVLLEESELKINWKPVNENGEMKILLTFTNHFATGGKDEYTTASTVPVKAGTTTVHLTEEQLQNYRQSGIMKIVLQAPLNTGNRWIRFATPK